MLKRVLLGAIGLIVIVLVVALTGLAWSHVSVRRERAPLPSIDTKPTTKTTVAAEFASSRVWYG